MKKPSFNNIVPKLSNGYHSVKGHSTINHQLRVKYDLTCDEYIVLEHMHNSKNEDVTPDQDEDYIWENLGFKYEHCMFIVECLMIKGMVKKESTGKVMVANIWKASNDVLEAQFEELWNIFKKGSKAGAKKKYLDLLKKRIVTHEVLMDRRKKYYDWKESTGTQFEYIMGLEFWLTESKRHWEDPLPIDKKESTVYKPMEK